MLQYISHPELLFIEFVTETNFGYNDETRYASFWSDYELELYPLYTFDNNTHYSLFVYKRTDEHEFIIVDNCRTQIPFTISSEQAIQFFIDAWLAFKRGLEANCEKGN